jgi:hypothetical protein
MKNIIRNLAFISLFAGAFFIANPVYAEPPNPPGGHGGGGNQPPAGAPLDGGLSILLALGAGYGGLKLYRNKKRSGSAEEEKNT